MDALLAVLAALAVVGFACAIWGIFIERQLFAVRRDSVRVLPPGSRPIHVLHVSDIHMAPWQRRKQRWLAATITKLIDRGEVDLVVNTGDNLGHARGIAPALGALAGALGKPGVFVNGSNDYFAPVLRNPLAYLKAPSKRGKSEQLATDQLIEGFESAGWLNLNNRGGLLEINGSLLGFIGVDDAHDGLAKLETLPDQAEANQAPSNGSGDSPALTIGVTHAPYLNVVRSMADAGATLVFAGHTHGGQVAIPGYGALVTNCDLPPRFAKGLSAWSSDAGNSAILSVSAGLGHSIYAPVRFAVRPELRVLTLLPE